MVLSEPCHDTIYLQDFRPGLKLTGLQSLIAEGFKFLTYEVEEFYYVRGEKKDITLISLVYIFKCKFSNEARKA